MENSKPTIFISHIIEERELAYLLKNYLEKLFLNSFNIFVSSHEESIQLGSDWLTAIKRSMIDCHAVILLCSPLSVRRPWINFEAGAGWVRQIPVIPLCHSSQSPGKLPVPLNSFQAGNINSPEDINKLLKLIAEIKGLTPPKNQQYFFDKVRAYESNKETNVLVKDSFFIFSLLHRDVYILTYSILASVNEMGVLQGADVDLELVKTEINFNKTYHLADFSILNFGEKVFETLYTSAHKIADDIKFILSNSRLNISSELDEILRTFLNILILLDNCIDDIKRDNQNRNKIDDLIFNLIKDEPLPPTRRQSNVINTYINYYEAIVKLRTWLLAYKSVMGILLNEYFPANTPPIQKKQ